MTEIRHNKRKVYAIGETVLDLVSLPLQHSNEREDGFTFRAVPGGSVLNASVSLGRMGIEIYLISEFGVDKAGLMIDEFLKSNNVNTSFILKHPERKTSLALAFLDSARNATYSFYHDSPEKLKGESLPDFQRDDILLFGSFYSVKPDRREFLSNVLQKATEAGSTIYYDLNIRKAHSGDLEILMPVFLENISRATVVKGSDEDFYNLFGLSDPYAVYEKVSHYCKIVLITNGSKPTLVFTPDKSKAYAIPAIKPVSTIGAGDNFNAGFIYGLATSDVNLHNRTGIPFPELDRMTGCGLAFATETCLSSDNYIKGNFEPDFWKKYI